MSSWWPGRRRPLPAPDKMNSGEEFQILLLSPVCRAQAQIVSYGGIGGRLFGDAPQERCELGEWYQGLVIPGRGEMRRSPPLKLHNFYLF